MVVRGRRRAVHPSPLAVRKASRTVGGGGGRTAAHPHGQRHLGMNGPHATDGRFTNPRRPPTAAVPWTPAPKAAAQAQVTASATKEDPPPPRCSDVRDSVPAVEGLSCRVVRQAGSLAAVTGTRMLDGPLGLVGAGYIGHLFAQQFALAGYEVRAWSPASSVHTLRDRLQQSLFTLAEIGAVAHSDVDDVLARVSVHDDFATALKPCAAVMEAIVEDADAKSACYRDIESVVDSRVLLWSATSNFPMTRLAAGMAHPERAVVVHPVQTQLIIFVEVVPGAHTSEETVTSTMRFCDSVDLRAVRVRKEIPGFLWNRVWFAMLREMLHLVDIGVADAHELDAIVQTTLRAFVPVFGPLQMTDLIGHDTLRDISNALYPELATDRTASTTVQQLVRDGRLGAKSGKGFYDDNDGRLAELTLKLYQVARQLDSDSP